VPCYVEQVSSRRFKQLLVYSVERSWCAVVRKVLDIAFENDDWEATFTELSEMSQEEASLLHRAVRNKNRAMVELLLDFSPSFLGGINDPDLESFKRKLEFKLRWGSIFKADMRGPAGLTPLHIAASMKDAEEVVDALTSGPFQVSAEECTGRNMLRIRDV
jgi:ankyrin repeat protein